MYKFTVNKPNTTIGCCVTDWPLLCVGLHDVPRRPFVKQKESSSLSGSAGSRPNISRSSSSTSSFSSTTADTEALEELDTIVSTSSTQYT